MLRVFFFSETVLGKNYSKMFNYVIIEWRCAYRDLVENTEVRKPLGRPRLRWDDGIKIDL